MPGFVAPGLEDLVKMSTGGVAGCVSRTAVAPLERLKILKQVQHVTGRTSKYGGIIGSLKTILHEEGFRGFYKGNGVNCLRVFPYIGTQFLCFDRYKGFALGANTDGTLTPVQKLFVGALSGMTSVVITYPLDFIRGRLTAQGGAVAAQYSGIVDAARQVVRTEGFLTLYTGIKPTLIGIAPYVGVNYLVYEQLKEQLPMDDPNNGNLYRLFCGGVAGTSGATVAFPLDLLRRRFQLQSMAEVPPERRYRSVGHAVKKIVREEGFRGLYKGFWPNFASVKVVPTIAIMFATNDALKGLWQRYKERERAE